jgi:hypothetical protein
MHLYVIIYNDMQNKSDRLSRIRQSLAQLADEIHQLLPVLNDRRPMIKGTVYEQRRKCGKPGCRCADGELHGSMMLSRSDGGRTKLMAIPSGHLKDFQVLTERYQRFRRARARLGQIYKAMVKLIDQLEKAKRKES